ncbi:MAG TPA: hypothetical protein VFY35_00420 [Burkholderiaceae bacterium]|nr:hypothetical protein [Burkholderiaceae bacterium]
MNARQRRPRPQDRCTSARVLDLTRCAIEQALQTRSRYRYVRPRIEREGTGWRIVSPNCSRSVDPQGGDIRIAWLRPGAQGRWQLHAHDDQLGAWVLRARDLSLPQALALLSDDPHREYWR